MGKVLGTDGAGMFSATELTEIMHHYREGVYVLEKQNQTKGR